MEKERKRTQKRLERLKKAHIWPSVVFLVLSVGEVVAGVLFTIGLVVSYFTMDRMQTAYRDAEMLRRMLTEARTEEEENGVWKYLEADKGGAEAAYLLGAGGGVIAGFGTPTYVWSPEGGKIQLTSREENGKTGEALEKSFDVYADKNSTHEIYNADVDMDIVVVIRRFIRMGVFSSVFDVWYRMSSFSGEGKKAVCEDCFWYGLPCGETDVLLVKSMISLYDTDFALAIVVGAVFSVGMLVPLTFLFFNVMINVHNQRRLTKLLYTDKVTGGNGRTFFEHYSNKAFWAKKNKSKLYAVVDISLMKYRSFCICHGMEEGEALLQKIDRQLASFLEKKEICAHFEKADFALLLVCEDREGGIRRVEEMLKALPGRLGHESLVFHAGIYFTGEQEEGKIAGNRAETGVAEYYNRAGSARASLADDSQTAVAVYDRRLLDAQLWEHRVEEKMQAALEKEEFQVYLQPKYNPMTERLAGAEALVRWVNEEDGFISPGRFIPIFEKNGFIVKLDDYMLSHVAKLQAQWISEGKNVVPVSVNVSRAHFANPELAKHICELVDAYQVPHHLIEIELTESAFFDDKEALLSTVRELKELGFDISMDDFGAGYSSLNSLKDLPLDVLKLDAEFFRGEDGLARGEVVVAQAIALAKQLNMRIVAEGVEKKEQVEFLIGQDCDMIQGFYFAKPMPAGEYEGRLEGTTEASEEPPEKDDKA